MLKPADYWFAGFFVAAAIFKVPGSRLCTTITDDKMTNPGFQGALVLFKMIPVTVSKQI